MDLDPVAVVEAGYDVMADEYLAYMADSGEDPRLRFLADLMGRLEGRSDLVDLGCGAGIPATRILAQHHSVLGVDVCASQIALARRNVPGAQFRKEDFSHLELPESSVAAVTAFYSLTHVPRVRHAELFHRIAGWLRPGGYLLLTLSASGRSDGMQDDFCGVPMYFSGFGPETNRELLKAASFAIVLDEVVPLDDAERSVFQWVLARRI